MLKRNGESYNIFNYSQPRLQELLKHWHENKQEIYCLCQKTHGYYPMLGVKRSPKGVYYLFNYPRNRKHKREHADDCPYNKDLQDFLKRKGISVNAAGDYIVHTDTSDDDMNSKLKFLSYALLQKYQVHRYIPNQTRVIHKRLYKAICETILNGNELSERVFIANPNYRYDYKRHQLVIGMTDLSRVVQEKNQVKMPLYSLKDERKRVTDIRIFERLFYQEKLDRRHFKYGFFFLWRLPDQKGILRDTSIDFIPCEPASLIPVFSTKENELVNVLIDDKQTFRKPLIMPKGFHKNIIREED